MKIAGIIESQVDFILILALQLTYMPLVNQITCLYYLITCTRGNLYLHCWVI